MTHNLRFPPAPRHTAEDDFLDMLGPDWSNMSSEERRLYAGPITLAREAAEEAAAEAVRSGITLADVADLIAVTLWFPHLVHSVGIRYVAERWCFTPGAVRLGEALETLPDAALGTVVLPFTVPEARPRARARRVG